MFSKTTVDWDSRSATISLVSENDLHWNDIHGSRVPMASHSRDRSLTVLPYHLHCSAFTLGDHKILSSPIRILAKSFQATRFLNNDNPAGVPNNLIGTELAEPELAVCLPLSRWQWVNPSQIFKTRREADPVKAS